MAQNGSKWLKMAQNGSDSGGSGGRDRANADGTQLNCLSGDFNGKCEIRVHKRFFKFEKKKITNARTFCMVTLDLELSSVQVATSAPFGARNGPTFENFP